jgi:hypothetical protein
VRLRETGDAVLRAIGSVVGWLIILLGANTFAFSLAGLVARIRAGRAGGVMFLDLRTPTYFEAMVTIALGCAILAAGIGIRASSSRRRR